MLLSLAETFISSRTARQALAHLFFAAVLVEAMADSDKKPEKEEAFPDDNDMGLVPKKEPDQEDPVTPPRKGKGQKRGKQAKDKDSNKDKDAGERGGRGKKNQPLTMCICPGCEWPKYPGSRFCSQNDHKRGFDNLMYQRRSRKDLTEQQKAEFDAQMKSDEFAGRTVLEFVKDCPPELRKKTLFDFARFERSKGVRVSAHEQSGDVPMTERAFYKHCDNAPGLHFAETCKASSSQPAFSLFCHFT